MSFSFVVLRPFTYASLAFGTSILLIIPSLDDFGTTSRAPEFLSEFQSEQSKL